MYTWISTSFLVDRTSSSSRSPNKTGRSARLTRTRAPGPSRGIINFKTRAKTTPTNTTTTARNTSVHERVSGRIKFHCTSTPKNPSLYPRYILYRTSRGCVFDTHTPSTRERHVALICTRVSPSCPAKLRNYKQLSIWRLSGVH